MSLPTAPLPNIRAIESWVDRPFTAFGDTLTKVYYIKCHCENERYIGLRLGQSNLGSASSAGLISSKYQDASARWVGDYNFSKSDGGYITFERRFANVPLTYSDYKSTVVKLPSYYTTKPRGLTFIGGNYPMTARVEYKFSTSPQAIQIKKPFKILEGTTNTEINYVNAATDIFRLITTDLFNPVVLTNPTGEQFYSQTERVSETTKIRKWMGDIYVGVTNYIKPIDVFN